LECFISLDLAAPQSAVNLPTQRVETVLMPPDSDEQRSSRRSGWQRLRRRLICEKLESPHDAQYGAFSRDASLGTR
jgi:hypothetical protein